MAQHNDGTDQPMPVPNNSVYIHDLVCLDVIKRKALGSFRYGTPLQAGNGRNALQDAYEEALDLCCYLKQKLVEESAVNGPAWIPGYEAKEHGYDDNHSDVSGTGSDQLCTGDDLAAAGRPGDQEGNESQGESCPAGKSEFGQ